MLNYSKTKPEDFSRYNKNDVNSLLSKAEYFGDYISEKEITQFMKTFKEDVDDYDNNIDDWYHATYYIDGNNICDKALNDLKENKLPNNTLDVIEKIKDDIGANINSNHSEPGFECPYLKKLDKFTADDLVKNISNNHNKKNKKII